MKSSQYSKLNKINNFYIQVNMAFSVTKCIHVSPTQLKLSYFYSSLESYTIKSWNLQTGTLIGGNWSSLSAVFLYKWIDHELDGLDARRLIMKLCLYWFTYSESCFFQNLL